jgi:adenylylsulfate reductase subunit A
MLDEGLKQLKMLKEDSAKMAAANLHELMRCWENYHRILSLEAHARHILYREETRYPGYYYRGDFNFIDDDKWKVFTNSTYDMETGEFTMSTKELVHIWPE